MRPVATYTVTPSLPEPLNRLPELAYNLWWAWNHEAFDLFRRIDQKLWEKTDHNPVRMLGMVDQERLNKLATDEGFLAYMDRVLRSFDDYMQERSKTAWYPRQFGEENQSCVAYFSFEFGIAESIPNYSGGLGVLAGDHLKAASDLNVPLVGVGLLYQQGYFRQYLNVDGWQQERYPDNDFYTMPIKLVRDDQGDAILTQVELPGRIAYAQIWRVQVGRISLFLMDTNISQNSSDDQELTKQLYGGDRTMRIKQEILLGIGGLRALNTLGLSPEVCHMNEGHAAFMSLERARLLMEAEEIGFNEALSITALSNVFTTHTPVPAGNDYFEPELFDEYFNDYRKQLGLADQELLALGRFDPSNKEEYFCMTILALNASAGANGVSKLHGVVAREMWQDIYPKLPRNEVPIKGLTNGIHTFTWVSPEMANTFDRYLGPWWRDDPTDKSAWEHAADIPDDELWRVHQFRRQQLVLYARKRLVKQLQNRGAPQTEIELAHEALDPDALTIGFARRFATYKRATLLLRDKERFMKILCGDRPIQFVFAGKAHPHDTAGKEFIRDIVQFARESDCPTSMVFLEDYDMVTGRYLVQGVDVWLNTPRRPHEASGTSGMKCILNGVLNLSILDGWWDEAYHHGVGWAIGNGEVYSDEEAQDYIESNALYDLIEKDLLPTFYDRGSDGIPHQWLHMMKSAIVELAPTFSMARTVQDYARDFYVPALGRSRQVSADGYQKGKTFAGWLNELRGNWETIKVGEIKASFNGEVRVGDSLNVQTEIYLGDVSSEDIVVELFEGGIDTEGTISDGHTHTMSLVGSSEQGKGWYRYDVNFESEVTGRFGYTVRVLPQYEGIGETHRLGLITWA